MYLFEKEPQKTIQHSGRFGSHSHCGSGDISLFKIVLICHAILEGHVTTRLCNAMGKSPSSLDTTLSSFVAIGTVVKKIKWF